MSKNSSAEFSDKVQKLAIKAKNDKKALSELIVLYSKRIQTMVVPMAESTDEVSDLSQEGLMGLCHAVKTYDEKRGAKFVTYASVCIKNNIFSALRKKPASTDNLTEELLDESFGNNTEVIAVDRVRYEEIKQIIEKVLSKTEIDIFKKYLQGKSYEVIANELDTKVKNVDNAMQRVRKKLKGIFSQ